MPGTRRPFPQQPIKQLLRDRQISLSQFIRETKLNSSHVWCAMDGVTPPSKELRVIAPMLLDVPLEELFTKEALAVEKQPARRQGPTQPCSICGRKRHTVEQAHDCQAARRAGVLTSASSSG